MKFITNKKRSLFEESNETSLPGTVRYEVVGLLLSPPLGGVFWTHFFESFVVLLQGYHALTDEFERNLQASMPMLSRSDLIPETDPQILSTALWLGPSVLDLVIPVGMRISEGVHRRNGRIRELLTDASLASWPPQ